MTDMQISLPLLIVQPSILNRSCTSLHNLWPVKWNALGYTFALRIPFHLLRCWCNTCTNQSSNDMIHFISSRDHIGSSTWPHLLFTIVLFHRHQVLLKLHRHTRSLASKPLTCPSHLQLVHRAKSYLDLLHLDHMTQCHVSRAISSSIITCASFAISPSHFHLHSICCSHTCTYELITCVSALNYQNQTRIFQPHKHCTCTTKPTTTQIWRSRPSRDRQDHPWLRRHNPFVDPCERGYILLGINLSEHRVWTMVGRLHTKSLCHLSWSLVSYSS
jgi:hypothetical protein